MDGKRQKTLLLIVLIAWALFLALGLRYINGYWFFFDLPDRSGWTGAGPERHYLDRHAIVVKDMLLEIDSKKYYFDSEGFVHTGEIELDGFVYCFDELTGVMLYGWVERGGDRYYFDEEGRKIIDREYTIGGSDFLFDRGGAEVVGLVGMNGRYYYFEPLTGKLKNGEEQDGGAWYYFTEDGSRFGTGWLTLADGRTVYYDGENGMLFGEQQIDGEPYLLSISRGARMTGTVYFKGEVYTVAEDGVVQGKQRLSLWEGIDVSVHQEKIDWALVADSGVQFAIVRAGYFAAEEQPVFNPDSRYAENALAAQENGLSVGAYVYVYNSSMEGLEEGLDAFHAYSVENRIRLDLPVFLDVEDKEYFKPGSDEQGGYGYRTAFVREGMERLRGLGYEPGFYTFQNWANNEFDAEGLFRQGYPFWLANWFGNNKDLDPATLSWNNEAQPSLWQYRATGQVPGIEKETDMDYLYWDRMRR